MKTLKKVIFLLVFTLTAVLGITANADDVIKISMDETVKKANNIGTGYGIEFILPDLDDNKFLIDSIELAVFEKTSDGENFEIYTDENGNETKKVLLQNPESLNFQVNFGDINLLRDKAKYKIGYRYYVKSVDDFSKVMIAGESIKDGWRLVGEVNPIAATDSGFAYYKNFKPEIIIDSLTFNGETIDGEKSFTIPFSEVESTYFPMNVLQNGLKVNYTATDFDSEDSLTVKYTLLDYIENTVIGTGDLTENNIITCNSDAEFVKLILTVSDDFGGEFEMQPVTIDEWSIKEEAHEAVISKQIFDTVQNLLKQDTVTVNTKKTPYLFSGFLYCADCKNSMVRRKVNDKYGTYVYYTCSYNRLGLGCSSHSIREDALSATVKNAISVYCRSVWELCDTLKGADSDIVEQERIQSIENAVAAKEAKIKDLNTTLSVIEKRFSDNKDDADSYRQLKEDISSEIAYIENEILTLGNEKKEVNSNINCYIAWLEEFNNMGEIKELNRTLLANIIEKIYIHEDKSIVIKFRYSDEYKKLLNLCEKLNTREAV